MMPPSMTTLLLGVAVIAVLTIVAWYVSRRTPVLLYTLSPSGARDANEEGDAAEFKKVA
jgi:hypothetical protein